MIQPCYVENKYFVVSLAEDIQLDTIALINKELYSSNIKELEILISTEYPTENWESIGQFTLNDTQGWQIIKLNKVFEARFLKLVTLEIYEDQHYCTLTNFQFISFPPTLLNFLKRVFGDTQYMKLKEAVEEINNEEVFIFDEKEFGK